MKLTPAGWFVLCAALSIAVGLGWMWLRPRATAEWVVVDRAGQVAFGPFAEAGLPSEGVIAVSTGARWALLTLSTGSQTDLVPPEQHGPVQTVRPVHSGRAAVEVDGRWGFVDATGAWVAPPTFAVVTDFVAGNAFAGNEAGRPSTTHLGPGPALYTFGVLNTDGAWVVPPRDAQDPERWGQVIAVDRAQPVVMRVDGRVVWLDDNAQADRSVSGVLATPRVNGVAAYQPTVNSPWTRLPQPASTEGSAAVMGIDGWMAWRDAEGWWWLDPTGAAQTGPFRETRAGGAFLAGRNDEGWQVFTTTPHPCAANLRDITLPADPETDEFLARDADSGLWGRMDSAGQWVTPPEWADVVGLDGRYAVVRRTKD